MSRDCTSPNSLCLCVKCEKVTAQTVKVKQQHNLVELKENIKKKNSLHTKCEHKQSGAHFAWTDRRFSTMAQVPTGIITHAQRVCRLYKKAVRLTQSWYTPRYVHFFALGLPNNRLCKLRHPTWKIFIKFFFLSIRHAFRYHAVLMRERFDNNKDIKDLRIARKLVEEGEAELFQKAHPQPIGCKYFELSKLTCTREWLFWFFYGNWQTEFVDWNIKFKWIQRICTFSFDKKCCSKFQIMKNFLFFSLHCKSPGANNPGGLAYGREVELPDWVLDYWHPLEKAQYPDYFARREQRKKEYVIWWEKQYGKSQPRDDHH